LSLFHGFIDTEGWIAMAVGIVASTPLLRSMSTRFVAVEKDGQWNASPAGALAIVLLLLVTTMKLANSSFNPFIYYRF
jgi:hypothetical protein